ncbi:MULTISPECIES: hypothetical protein [unclassified Rhizobium]|uniref:hypothetical protein n=1 Tax=unclassified Rhizobium TaxID=2613769 RepID=UPI0006F4C6B9|nr:MULTISPECIES: hypothetical protein [unclassified Rhizobium]KQV34450.1 hypothetical protein ASC86_16105 [Rhizobium sp. Root1212]KRD25406.1 hypothetical protein ASE37_24820 [Rhizobium sp. Root268]
MTPATSFVSELVRAANEVHLLTTSEVSRLLDRAVDTIRDLRGQVGVKENSLGRDVVVYLQTASARAKWLPLDQAKDALLDAANTIRTLKIVLDSKDEALGGN